MLFHFALLADASSLLDPDWWVRNFGPLGVILLGLWMLIRAFGRELKQLLISKAELVDELRVQQPQQTKAIDRIEKTQSSHTEELATIKTLVQPRGA